MGDPHPAELRERVVAAYCCGEGAYAVIAARFGVGEASVKRWVQAFVELAPPSVGAVWGSPV